MAKDSIFPSESGDHSFDSELELTAKKELALVVTTFFEDFSAMYDEGLTGELQPASEETIETLRGLASEQLVDCVTPEDSPFIARPMMKAGTVAKGTLVRPSLMIAQFPDTKHTLITVNFESPDVSLTSSYDILSQGTTLKREENATSKGAYTREDCIPSELEVTRLIEIIKQFSKLHVDDAEGRDGIGTDSDGERFNVYRSFR